MTDTSCTGYIDDNGTQCPLKSHCYRHETPRTASRSWYVRGVADGCEEYWPATEEADKVS